MSDCARPVENLEKRILLATLLVQGSAAADNILITQGTAGITVKNNGAISPLTSAITATLGTTAFSLIGGASKTFASITELLVDGGNGNDLIQLGNTVTIRSTIKGSGGNDVIVGGKNVDSIIGGDGNDILRGGFGNDIISGDSAIATAGSDQIYGDAGNDSLSGGPKNDVIYGDNNDTNLADDGNDTLAGGDGDDLLDGDGGSDTMRGDAGNDTFTNYDGKIDNLDGGDGAFDRGNSPGADGDIVSRVEILESTIGSAVNHRGVYLDLFGSNGNDTIALSASGDRVTFTLNGSSSSDTFSSIIANLRDPLTGNPYEGSLMGFVLHGGGGNDVITVGPGFEFNEPIHVSGEAGNDTINGSSDAEMLNGDAGNDVIRGNGGNDSLFGGSGADRLEGGDGNDSLAGDILDDLFFGDTGPIGADTFFGGNGVDEVTYIDPDFHSVGNLVIDKDNVADDGRLNEHDNITTDVEIITGAEGNDSITGSNGNDTLSGGTGGQDTLVGLGGDDFLAGGALLLGGEGNDTLAGRRYLNDTFLGGNGVDSADYSSYDDFLPVTLSLDGVANDGYGDEQDDIRSDVENLFGGQGNDFISGNDLNNSLRGGGGNDQMSGGAGNDVLRGDDGNDVLNGENDNDTLDGGIGADVMIGGLGGDSADYASRTTPIFVDLAPANDFAGNEGVFGEGDDVQSDIENISGGSNNDSLRGNDSPNFIAGNSGNDTILGFGGNDFLRGFDGNDSVVGGSGNDNLTGDNQNDQLFGEIGNDILDGGTGSDLMAGGDGNDTADYRSRATRVLVSLDNTFNDGSAPEGSGVTTEKDNVDKFVETILGGGGNDDLRGREDTANFIDGGAGNDYIRPDLSDSDAQLTPGSKTDTLVGGVGNDTLDAIFSRAGHSLKGGDGNDTLRSGAGNDSINGEGGTDTASYSNRFAPVTVTFNGLADDGEAGKAEKDNIINTENFLGGGSNDKFTGDNNANKAEGGGGNDSLFGSGGNDTLIGGSGNDTLSGGEGDDLLDGLDGIRDTLIGGGGTADKAKRDSALDQVSEIESFI